MSSSPSRIGDVVEAAAARPSCSSRRGAPRTSRPPSSSARAARVDHVGQALARDHDDAVGVADDPVAARPRTPAAPDRDVDRAGLVLAAPGSAIIDEKTGNPRAWISAMSRTPPSMTRPGDARGPARRW